VDANEARREGGAQEDGITERLRWSGCTTQQVMRDVFGPVVQQGIARARAQASLIIRAVAHPIATAREILGAIVNPPVKIESIELLGTATVNEELIQGLYELRDLVEEIDHLRRLVQKLKVPRPPLKG
jgi:hypothetical protein